jgi:hypothetical protein
MRTGSRPPELGQHYAAYLGPAPESELFLSGAKPADRSALKRTMAGNSLPAFDETEPRPATRFFAVNPGHADAEADPARHRHGILWSDVTTAGRSPRKPHRTSSRRESIILANILIRAGPPIAIRDRSAGTSPQVQSLLPV